MATMWCPQCRSEYREGIVVCADCGAALVDSLPPTVDHNAHGKLTGPFLPDDDLVQIARTNAVDAEMIAAQLRGAGMQAVVFGVGTAGELQLIQHSQGSRVMVRRADVEVAGRLVADLEQADASAPIDDDELAALADESKGWSDPSTGAVV